MRNCHLVTSPFSSQSSKNPPNISPPIRQFSVSVSASSAPAWRLVMLSFFTSHASTEWEAAVSCTWRSRSKRSWPNPIPDATVQGTVLTSTKRSHLTSSTIYILLRRNSSTPAVTASRLESCQIQNRHCQPSAPPARPDWPPSMH